ncbi:MAG: hypothetical protein H6985_06495 [Pseudomonadales bacterium]|nr:hypothetical protein [Halioglobus sp.]MCP5129213.1 hypothetical protein [Pseudomonadales bacterium]
MKLLQKFGSHGCIAALAALLLMCSNANAIQIDIGGFANNGSLSIMFEGTELGGDPDKLEFLSPDDLTSFSAIYSDDGLLGTLVWERFAVGSMVYNVATSTLESLSAVNFLNFYELSVAGSVLDTANYVEITNLFTDQMLASSQQFPGTAPAPVPGTLLLFSLGLFLIAGRGRA